MKVRAIINFNDLKENIRREAGKSEWECSEERAKFLLDHKAVEIIEDAPIVEKKEIIEEPKKSTKKKSNKK